MAGKRHGGARHGAGRRSTVTKTLTRVVADRINSDGELSMLEIMAANARYFYQAALQVEQVPLPTPEGETDVGVLQTISEAIKSRVSLRLAAQTCAQGAAQYCHPRLAQAQPATARQDFIPLPERLKEYARRDLIDGSEGKVVEINRG